MKLKLHIIADTENNETRPYITINPESDYDRETLEFIKGFDKAEISIRRERGPYAGDAIIETEIRFLSPRYAGQEKPEN